MNNTGGVHTNAQTGGMPYISQAGGYPRQPQQAAQQQQPGGMQPNYNNDQKQASILSIIRKKDPKDQEVSDHTLTGGSRLL